MVSLRLCVEGAAAAAAVWYVMGMQEGKLSARQVELFGGRQWLCMRPELMGALERLLVVCGDEWGVERVRPGWEALCTAVDFCAYSEIAAASSRVASSMLPRDCGVSVNNVTGWLMRVWDALSPAGQKRCQECVNLLHNAVLHSETQVVRIAPSKIPGIQ